MLENIKKYVSVTAFRRGVQLFVFILFITGPLFQLIHTLRENPYPYTESIIANSTVFNWIFTGADHSIRKFLDAFYNDITGGPYTLKIYFLHLTEPLTAAVYAIKSLFSPETFNLYLAFSFALPLIAAAFFGRIYCGYVCPMSALVSFHLKIRKRFGFAMPQESASPGKLPAWNRWYFFALFFLILIQPAALPYILPPAVFQNAWSDLLLFGGFTLWGISLLLLVIFEAAKPAYFCRYLCPTGLFLTRAGHLRKIQIEYVPDTHCEKNCHACNEVCWLGLNPKTQINDPACDLCHRCVSHCPVDRIKLFAEKKTNPGKIITAKILLYVFILILPFQTRPIFSELGYENPGAFRTIEENSSLSISDREGMKLNLYYSVIASDKAIHDSGTAYFHLHIKKGKDEIYAKPINITIINNDKNVSQETLGNVNFPISIGKASIYRISFPFEHNRLYTIIIASPSKDFTDISIRFKYPKTRF